MRLNKIKINMKSKGILLITYFEKDEEDKLRKTDELMTKISRRDFEESLQEDIDNGIEHKIEYVNAKPEKFQMGVIYILRTPKGRPDYVYTYQLN